MATVVRFVLLRGWVFHPAAHRPDRRRARSDDPRTRALRRPQSSTIRPPPSALGTPRAVGAAGRHRRALPVGARRGRLGQQYYAAAVQAGTQNWKALLFGSIDAGNAITVDKPPAALWVMGLSGRIFGFGTLSMLVPQALMGVASVGAAVRRGAPGQRLRGGTARRCCAGADTGGGVDVSVQQPGRAAGAAVGGRWLLRDPRARRRLDPLGCPGRRRGRVSRS